MRHRHLRSRSHCQISALKTSDYEPLLKEDLSCHHCDRAFKNMPQLKGHLQEEWDALRQRGSRKRRKSPDESEQDALDEPPAAKKRAIMRAEGTLRE